VTAETDPQVRFEPNELPDLVADIRVVDGVEGQQLATQQARVLWEVTQWQVRNKSERGQSDAA
jgi:hypothetical protein